MVFQNIHIFVHNNNPKFKCMKNAILVSFLGIALMFASCGKYEEGPSFSLRSKKARAVGVWTYEKVLANGTEVNISFFADSKFELMDNDKYQVRAGNIITEEGTWNFGTGKETIEVLETGSSTKNVSTILRLTNDEFWTTTVENGVTMEVHMIAE